MAQTDDIFSAIDRAVTGPAKGSLSRWMRRNYTALFERLDGHPNDWTALTEAIAPLKLQDRAGNSPSAQTARKTWERIRRDHQKANPAAKVDQTERRQTASRSLPVTRSIEAPNPDEDDEEAIVEPANKFVGRRPTDRVKPPGTT